MKKTLTYLPIFPWALLSASACLAATSPTNSMECLQVPLAERPLWISSAVWIPQKGEIAAVDTLKNRIILIAPSGRVEAANLSAKDPAQSFIPAELVSSQSGYLLKLFGSPPRALQLDQSLASGREVSFPSKASPGSLRSVYEWVGADGDVVGYGTVARSGPGEKAFSQGFFRVPATLTGRADLLLPFDDGDYYVLGHRYLASVGGTAYFVLMNEKPQIFQAPHGKGAKALGAFPAEYQQAPKLLSPMAGPRDASALFKEIEGLTIPVGLYGQGNMLYLLTRKPDSQGATSWSLFQIDPQKDQVIGELRLPTKANHLTVVPSPEAWFLFEKGPVESPGAQNISSLLSIPASWINVPAGSPLNAANPKVNECRSQKK